VKLSYAGKEDLAKELNKENIYKVMEENESSRVSQLSLNDSVTYSQHISNVIEDGK